MNTKDRFTKDNKSQKKFQSILNARNQQFSSTYIITNNYLINKNELNKAEKSLKSAKSMKSETNIFTNFKYEKNLELVEEQQKPCLNKQFPSQAAKKNTKQNNHILVDLEANFNRYEIIDSEKTTKRWSDIPIKPSSLLNNNLNRTNYLNTNGNRPKLDSIQGIENTITRDFTDNKKSSNRNNSFNKLVCNQENIQPLSTRSNNTRNTSKSFFGRDAMNSSNQLYNMNNKDDTNKNKLNKQNCGQFTKKHSIPKEAVDPIKNDNMIINQENINAFFQDNTCVNITPINQAKQIKQIPNKQDVIITYEKYNGGGDIYCVRPDLTNIPKDITPKNNAIQEEIPKMNGSSILNINDSNQKRNFSSQTNAAAFQKYYFPISGNESNSTTQVNNNINPNGITASSATSYYGNASNNRSFTMISDNEKKSAGKSISNSNSTHSGNIKTKTQTSKSSNRIQKYSDQKTESTYISGGDSPSPLLDCDEALSTKNPNADSTKNDPYMWIEKFYMEFENSVPDQVKGLKIQPEPYANCKVLNDNTEDSMQLEYNKTQEDLKNYPEGNASCALDSETISYLVIREADYCPDPYYFDKKQPQITWIMRAILLDWMMEVCMEFTLKRETYYYAVNYVDRYMSIVPNIQKWELQLIGLAAMYISAKMEEIYAPKVADFARSADNGYTTQQIMEMEQKMLKALKWLLTPPTLNTWASWYMNQWDLYIEYSPYESNHPLTLSFSEGLIQFKQPNEKSYARFREIMQLIDCSILDIQTLQYNQRTLIAAILYLILGKNYQQFSLKQIIDDFPKSSLYLLDNNHPFNDLFQDFLQYSFGFQLSDILPSIQYLSGYFRLPLNFDLPTAAKVNKENVLEGHFEEFLAYQTHHPYAIDFIKQRSRNLY